MTLFYDFQDHIDFIKKHFSNEYDERECNNEYINKQLNEKFTDKNTHIEINIGGYTKLIINLDKSILPNFDNILISHKKQNIEIKCVINYCENINIKYKNIYKINLSTHDNSNIYILDNIIKNEEDRGKGIGSEGMQILLNFLKNAGYVKLEGELSGIDNMCRMIKFYKKNGFDVVNNNISFIFCNKFKKTNEILKKYKNNVKALDISGKNIQGILDLNKFKELEELNCSHNKITKIINIPRALKYINCSNNNMTELYGLSDNLTGINCKSNPLQKLYYPFNIRPNKYPSKLTYLRFGDYFNQLVDNLPSLITHLIFGDYFNQLVDNLPSSITHLTFGDDFNQLIDNLPNSITHLTFGNNFNQSVDNLPNSLTNLILPNKYDIELKYLPKSLKYISIGGEYNKSIDNLPESIEEIFFQKRFVHYDHYVEGDYDEEHPNVIYQQINKLPNNIKKIIIGNYDIIEKNKTNNLLEEFRAYIAEKKIFYVETESFLLNESMYDTLNDLYS